MKKIILSLWKSFISLMPLIMIYCNQETACPFTNDTCDFYWQNYTKVLVPWISSLCVHTSNTERFHITWDCVQYFSFHPQGLKFMALTHFLVHFHVHFLGSLIWNRLPNLVKSGRSVSEFKNVIKKIGNLDCGCMICRR